MTMVRALLALLFFFIVAPVAHAQQANLTTDEVLAIQHKLFEYGYSMVGIPDGKIGPNTREAISKWQERKGLAVTGVLTREEADFLISLDFPTGWLWGALSASTDDAYQAYWNYSSGVAAYKDALVGCRNRSNSPQKCAVVAGFADEDGPSWLAAVRCNQDEGAVKRVGIAITSSPSRERAIENAFNAEIMEGYYRGNCWLLALIAADGSHE